MCEVGLSGLDTAKIFKKILLHPGQFVLPQRIYRDCHGLDADGTLLRINELVEEGLGTLIQRTQQQAVLLQIVAGLWHRRLFAEPWNSF